MEEKASNINSLMMHRERTYDKYSTLIISLIDDKLTSACHKFFKTDKTINWLSIERVSGLPQYVTIIGNIEVGVGDKLVKSDGSEVIIDEDNIKKHMNAIRIFLSIKILQNGTDEDILKELKFITQISTTLTVDDLTKILSDPEFVGEESLLNNTKFHGYLSKLTKPNSIEGFDTSTLSETQISQLMLSKAIIGKVN